LPRLRYEPFCLSICLFLVFRVAASGRFSAQTAANAEPVAAAPAAKSIEKRPPSPHAAPAEPKEKMEPLPNHFLAFDVSRPFPRGRSGFDAAAWARFCKASKKTGRRMVVVQARGTHSSSPYADLLLKGARASGLRTAGYVFLNFGHSSPSGAQQAKLALKAMGDEASKLDFMVVDVENGAAGKMTAAERVNRIGQAVEVIAKAGLRPVIYAKNTGGRRGEWTDLTGNSTDFAYLPLWVPRYDQSAELDTDGNRARPWKPFGGWPERRGKQFADDRLTVAPEGIPADENVFHKSILEGPTEPRPYGVTGLVKVQLGASKRDPKTGDVVQAVRLVNRSKSAIIGPISLVLENLTEHSPLKNGTGEHDVTGDPYVRIPSSTLPPGGSVKTQLRFDPATSARPSFQPEVMAGSGNM
jgi:hypothetical protein